LALNAQLGVIESSARGRYKNDGPKNPYPWSVAVYRNMGSEKWVCVIVAPDFLHIQLSDNCLVCVQ
jgi:hypothetical protein